MIMSIKERALNRLNEIYGDSVNEDIIDRLNYEIDELIDKHHLEDVLNDVANYVNEEKRNGKILLPKITLNNSFLYYLLGIGDVNPLPRHTYCPKCHYFSWGENKKKSCRCCGASLIRDGYNLPFDILLHKIEKGKISFSYSSDIDFKHPTLPIWLYDTHLARFVEELDIDINALPTTKELIEIDKCLRNPKYYNKKYRRIELCGHGPFLGVPDFGNKAYPRYIKLYDKLNTFDDFVKFYALMHGTKVNASNDKFILTKNKNIQGSISSFDELYQLLRKYQIDKEDAMRMINEIRQGDDTRLSKLSLSQLHEAGVDEKYILFMNNIYYIFFKGHCISHLRAVLNIATRYLKDPESYYKAYFKINNDLVSKIDKNSDLIRGYVEHRGTELEETYLVLLDCIERGIRL